MDQINIYLKTYFNIQEEDLPLVTKLFDIVSFKRGVSILKSEQYCRNIFFIKSGILRIFALNDGKEITQWIATENNLMTDFNSFLLHQPARWNIEAITDVTLYSISKRNYDEIVNIVPNWSEIEKSFIVNCFTTMENRIFQFLSLSAENRYLHFYHNNKSLFNQVPLQYLASMLGMTPETFSRIRKKNS